MKNNTISKNSKWTNLISFIKVKVIKINGIIVEFEYFDKSSLMEEYGILNYRKYLNKTEKYDLNEFLRDFVEYK